MNDVDQVTQMNDQEQQETTTIAETKHLRLVQRGRWSYVTRPNANGVVCIVALTADDKVLLIEQYRPPVGCHVIELPAGLSGDLPNQADEALEEAARRELLEETGYQANDLWPRAVVASSAGLTDEVVTIFVAGGLEKIAAGGGDESENITIHEVPFAEVDDWIARAQADGKLVDSRVYAGLHFLRQDIRDGE